MRNARQGPLDRLGVCEMAAGWRCGRRRVWGGDKSSFLYRVEIVDEDEVLMVDGGW